MSRRPNPLNQVKKDVDLSLKLWRATAEYYIKRLQSGDNLSTREAEQVNIFLRNNEINLSKFVSLNQVGQTKTLEQLAGGLDAPLKLSGGESAGAAASGAGVSGVGIDDPRTLNALSALEFNDDDADEEDRLIKEGAGETEDKQQKYRRKLDDLPEYSTLE